MLKITFLKSDTRNCLVSEVSNSNIVAGKQCAEVAIVYATPKVDKTWQKIPHTKTPSWIRRPGVQLGFWYLGGP